MCYAIQTLNEPEIEQLWVVDIVCELLVAKIDIINGTHTEHRQELVWPHLLDMLSKRWQVRETRCLIVRGDEDPRVNLQQG